MNQPMNRREAKAYAKALRPWYRKKRWWVLGGGAALIVIIAASAGGGGSRKSSSTPNANGIVGRASEVDDVTPGACEVTVIKSVEMKVSIRNNSSKRSNYLLEGVAEAGGTKVADLNGFTQNVEPGGSASEKLVGVGSLDNLDTKDITCRLVKVSRVAAT